MKKEASKNLPHLSS